MTNDFEIIDNKSRRLPDGYNENEISDVAASFLIDRGYPVMTEDKYKLAQEIYEKNYGNTDRM